jgi:hypothetical protein
VSAGLVKYRVDHGWFNTKCFTAVPFTDVRFGTAPRVNSRIRLDAINNWDVSFAKNTALNEVRNLRFTAEFYNAFNRPRFGAPGNQVVSPLFGLVTTQVNRPRAIQLGLRIDF